MNKAFYKLDIDKQNNIINAALSEFAATGYKKTSMNSIAKVAGISKGLLFYYFDTKKELYLYLYEYCHESYIQEVEKIININGNDFFELFIEHQNRKIEIMKRHPEIFVFLNRLNSEVDDEVCDNLKKAEIIKRHPEIFAINNEFTIYDEEVSYELNQMKEYFIDQGWKSIIARADMSKFKDNVDFKKLSDIMMWCVEGYTNNILKNNTDGIEFKEYILFLKKFLYKDNV